MKTLLTLLLGIAVGAAGWEYYREHWRGPDDSVPPSVTYPVDRVLTNQAGTRVSATIHGRTRTHVQFVRTVDHASFDYPIALLSLDDQQFLATLPETSAVRQAAAARAASGEPAEVARLRKRRDELQHEVSILTLELQKRNDPKPRMPRDEARRLLDAHTNEIIAIDQKLLDLSFRTSP